MRGEGVIFVNAYGLREREGASESKETVGWGRGGGGAVVGGSLAELIPN